MKQKVKVLKSFNNSFIDSSIPKLLHVSREAGEGTNKLCVETNKARCETRCEDVQILPINEVTRSEDPNGVKT